jgi:hypothetical protein
MHTIPGAVAVVATVDSEGRVHADHHPVLAGRDGVLALLTMTGVVDAQPQPHLDTRTGQYMPEPPGRAVRYWHPSMVRDGRPVTLATVTTEASAAAIAGVSER